MSTKTTSIISSLMLCFCTPLCSSTRRGEIKVSQKLKPHITAISFFENDKLYVARVHENTPTSGLSIYYWRFERNFEINLSDFSQHKLPPSILELEQQPKMLNISKDDVERYRPSGLYNHSIKLNRTVSVIVGAPTRAERVTTNWGKRTQPFPLAALRSPDDLYLFVTRVITYIWSKER